MSDGVTFKILPLKCFCSPGAKLLREWLNAAVKMALNNPCTCLRWLTYLYSTIFVSSKHLILCVHSILLQKWRGQVGRTYPGLRGIRGNCASVNSVNVKKNNRRCSCATFHTYFHLRPNYLNACCHWVLVPCPGTQGERGDVSSSMRWEEPKINTWEADSTRS